MDFGCFGDGLSLTYVGCSQLNYGADPGEPKLGISEFPRLDWQRAPTILCAVAFVPPAPSQTAPKKIE
jgi:hypothetical protein